MASIIPGYELDIFISYRQKDNKGDRWVSEFVDSLKTELESTFKEEISVYFDINPHDGLLETHDVDESLKEKLKCLVFIPIISRTYCDPKSFAWEHEFKAFVELASKDQFGLKVKLPNGNVASRVLPVRIHDLDNEDVKCFEGVIGGVIRTLDFVFKTASGVNRPLKFKEDHPGDNLNKTYYQDQINKVALAIKEIVQGMKAEPIQEVKEKISHKKPLEELKKEERRESDEKPGKLTRNKFLSGVIIIAILIVAVIFAYPKVFKKDTLDRLRSSGERISVAVMPFQNKTNDTNLDYMQEVIQDNMINVLSNYSSGGLIIRQPESISDLLQNKGITNYASITPSVASAISQKLDANVFVYGNLNKEGTTIRLNARLIDSKTKEVFKSFQLEGISEKIMTVIDSLSVQIRDFFLITILKKDNVEYQNLASTNSPEAYRYFILGKNARSISDYPTAIKWFMQALDIDSNLTVAMRLMSYSYGNQGLYEDAKKWILKLYKKKDIMSDQEKIWTDKTYAEYFQTPNEAIKYLKQLQQIDDKSPVLYYNLGLQYNTLLQYDKAIPEFEKALEIYNKWDLKPFQPGNYAWLASSYIKTGQNSKAKKILIRCEKDFPDHPSRALEMVKAVISLAEGDTVEANRSVDKIISKMRSSSFSEADIATFLAKYIYSEAGILDKAEEYYRKALSLEPEASVRMNDLGYFLIDKDRDINRGLELVDKALEVSPDDYNSLHSKGWGLYKQGKYKEAKEILQKSWDLRMKNAIYDHEAFLHLEAAKKAVANQKNN